MKELKLYNVYMDGGNYTEYECTTDRPNCAIEKLKNSDGYFGEDYIYSECKADIYHEYSITEKHLTKKEYVEYLSSFHYIETR